jgi:hypothetical protein
MGYDCTKYLCKGLKIKDFVFICSNICIEVAYG